jgi:hypothetical protein
VREGKAKRLRHGSGTVYTHAGGSLGGFPDAKAGRHAVRPVEGMLGVWDSERDVFVRKDFGTVREAMDEIGRLANGEGGSQN